MEIEKKINETTTFEELAYGDVFIDDDGDVVMVVDADYGLGLDESYYGYGVNLKTGSHYAYNASDVVIKVFAKLTVTNKPN